MTDVNNLALRNLLPSHFLRKESLLMENAGSGKIGETEAEFVELDS